MSRGAVDSAGGSLRRNGGVISTPNNGKRKMVSEEDWSPSRAGGASRRPPMKKPMHDAMAWKHGARRSSAYRHEEEEASSGSTDARHAEEEKTMIMTYDDYDNKFGGNNPQVSHALLVGLAEHGASAPWFVDSKELTDTDAKLDQNRLQLPRTSPISQVLTPAEMAMACVLNNKDEALMVMTFDRRGKMYPMKYRFFLPKCFCRLMGKWGDFLRDHRLGLSPDGKLGRRRVVVEVWAFRSHALPNGCTTKDGTVFRFDCGHPDGALGLVVLHREEVNKACGESKVMMEAPISAAEIEEDAEEEEEEEEAAVVMVEHLEQAVASVQENAAPAEPVQAQEDAPPGAITVHEEEVAAGAYARNGEAGAHAASYESKLMQVAAAMLLVLRTSDRTKCKPDDKDAENGGM